MSDFFTEKPTPQAAMPDLDIGSLLKAILPGVAALTTKRPESVMRTINVLQAGEQSSDKKRIKQFGIEALRLGADSSPEMILQLAAKHKVNPKVAMEYLNQFTEFRRAKKVGRLDDLKLRNAERESQRMDSKDDFLSSIMGAGSTPLDALEMGGMAGVNLPGLKRNELTMKGMKAGYLPAQVEGVFDLIGLDKPKPPTKDDIKLQKIETVDASGNPVTKYLPIEDVIGQEFPKWIKPGKETGKDREPSEKDEQMIRVRKLNAFSKLRGFSDYLGIGDPEMSDKIVQDVINYNNLLAKNIPHFEAMQEARRMTDQKYPTSETADSIPGPSMTESLGFLGNKNKAIEDVKSLIVDGYNETLIRQALSDKGWKPEDIEDILNKAQGNAAPAAKPANQPDPLGIR